MANIDLKPPQKWLDLQSTLEDGLCNQLALENVVYNFSTLLAPEIVEELKKPDPDGNVLIENDEFDTDVLVRRNLRASDTFEESKQILIDLESTILGFSVSQMGDRQSTRPYDSAPRISELLEGKDDWLFRFRSEELGTFRFTKQGDNYRGLRDTNIFNFLLNRTRAEQGYRSLTFEDLQTLLFFNIYTTAPFAMRDVSSLGVNSIISQYGGLSAVQQDSTTIVDLIRKGAKPGIPTAEIQQLFSQEILRVPASNRRAVTNFRKIYKDVAKILIKFAFGTSGGLGSDPGRVNIGDRALISQECIDKKTEEIINNLIPEVLEQIEETARIAQTVAGAAIIDRPEELIPPKGPPPKLTPFDFQCFLLENISKLVDQRENGAFASNYKNIVKVSNNGDPGSVINTIQHGNKDYIKHFLDICPEVYGLLTPYLKISRLEYDDVGNVKLDRNGRSVEKDLRIPNFLTQNDVQNILDGAAGRAPGAGIKSFSWALDGVQPAEVDNNISATLVMYFQSINDFFNGARSAGQDEPNFLDLIINSPGVRKLRNKQTGNEKPDEKPCSDDLLRNKLHQDYEGHNFRVKICAGWATPPIEALKQLTKNDEKAEALEKAFNDSRISLFLQMTQHQINFNQNGTLELTVSYQASLAGLLTGKTADIFDVSSKLIEQDIEEKEKESEVLNERADKPLAGDKQRKKELLEEIKELKNIDRNVKYKKLLKRIFSSAPAGASKAGDSRIYNISLNPNELTLTPYKDLSPTDRQRRVKRRETDETFQFQTIPEFNNELLNAIEQSPDAGGSETANAFSNTAVKTFDQLTDQQKINIPFFFLGDLIDTVIEEIKSNNQKNAADGAKPLNFQMFISDVEMIDPLQAFKLKNLEDLVNCGYDLKDITFIDAASKENPLDNTELNGIYRTMNIGDIPISLDAFQLWFKDNVVKSEKNTYFLLYFIKDICKDLITKALSSKCFGKEFNFQQRFDAQPLTLGLKQGKINEFISNETYPAKKVGEAQAEVRCGLDSAQTKLGLLLYSTDSRPRGLLGMKSYDNDTNRGIYHHYLGSACGLVKTINFSRQDQAYLRESRIQKEGALGAEQLRELYSADIDLVGNTLYKNGMYIYINPSLLGASQEYLDYLGLHGYYLVTSVKSTVTPSSFDVSISALHEGIEFKDNKLLPATGDVGRFFEEGFQPEAPPHDVVRREIKQNDEFREQTTSYIDAVEGRDQSPEAQRIQKEALNTGAAMGLAMARGTQPPR